MDLFEKLEIAGGLESYQLALVPAVANMVDNSGREGTLAGIKMAIAQLRGNGDHDAVATLERLYEREASRPR